MSILIPVDYHASELPETPLDREWLAQIPPQIAKEHPAKLVCLDDWRDSECKPVGDDILRGIAPKEMRRARFAEAEQAPILENLARFWLAAERYLDRKRPAAIALWNCGNADQNVWAMLATERYIPVMHCEHGWLPQTRIFDPVGGYVSGHSGWDTLGNTPNGEWAGAAIIRLWRRARLSKHLQGGSPTEKTREFCADGPALLVAMQLEADGAAVYNDIEFNCQREFIRKCLTWPGPVLVKAHPVAAAIEWEPAFAEERRLCRLEVEAKGGKWLGANQSIHELMPMVSAVAAINSNVLLEAAMMGKPALSFGQGPHSGRGFTIDMKAGDSWPLGDQTTAQWAATCEHLGRMETYLTPDGTWLPGRELEMFWGFPFWEKAQAQLMERWESLLSGIGR